METREAHDAGIKSSDTARADSRIHEVATEPLLSKPLFEFHELNFQDSSDTCSTSSDQENDFTMTKDIMKDRMRKSNPINIPRLKVTNVEAIHEEDRFSNDLAGSPLNSVGDSVYDSPKLPRPSNDFNHVMIKLRSRSDIKRVLSCEDVIGGDSDGESCISSVSGTTSSSLPATSVPRRSKGRRTVRFDEATITLTAELGESAARFRSQWRKKRANNNSPRFGESKNITVRHDDDVLHSPQLDRSDNGKSIFDVCNYSSYGRYA